MKLLWNKRRYSLSVPVWAVNATGAKDGDSYFVIVRDRCLVFYPEKDMED